MRFRKVLTLFDDYYDMMADRVRMDAYRKAIFDVVREGDVVVDLGAGLGILSFFAIQAGAGKVYAIEKMDSIHLAEEVARINGLDSRMVFIKENSKDVELEERADVLISETLGSFALEENTLEFTIDARKRFLKEGARMIPERLKLWLAPVYAPETYERMEFWRDIHGIDFSPAREELLRKLIVTDIDQKGLLSPPKVFGEVDLYRVEDPVVKGKVEFEVMKPGTLHGFGGWFRVWLTRDIWIDTSPSSPPTHWKQAFFPLRKPIRVKLGDRVSIDLRVAPREEDNTTISYDCIYFPGQGRTVGRNDPCPCGSGKKYKKCCGR